MNEGAKAKLWPLLNMAIMVAIILGLLSAWSLYKYQKSIFPSRTIYVSAEGKMVVKPDIAKVTVSVVTEGLAADTVTEQNVKKVNDAVAYIKSQGISENDIQTANYSLAPRYEYSEATRRSYISGYTATQSILITFRDFTKIGKVLGVLPGMGINQIGSLSFEVENPDTYLNEARKKAFANAHEKAENMAKQNDVDLGGIVTFSESPNVFYPRAYESAVMGKGGDATSSYTPPQIEPGTQEVTVSVSVTYEID